LRGNTLCKGQRSSIAGMNKAKQPRGALFVIAIPLSLYVSVFGTLSMGLCSGPSAIPCWPHTFAWTLLAPSLLLAIWSVPATAIAAVLLLFAHLFTEVHFYKESMGALWDTDMALDKCFWIVVLLLVFSALLPKKIAIKG
jgi:hypothetical protein